MYATAVQEHDKCNQNQAVQRTEQLSRPEADVATESGKQILTGDHV